MGTKILMAQLNSHLGDIEANTQQVIDVISEQQKDHDIIVFPELYLTGYPPEDLLYRNEMHVRVAQALQKIAAEVGDCYVIVGHPTKIETKLYNSASVFYQQQSFVTYHKHCLPNYGVFDEKRYFTEGHGLCQFKCNGRKFAVAICEDLWHEAPLDKLLASQTDCVLCLNASPFYANKAQEREALIKRQALKGIDIVYVNLVGGQDELVFDGQSFMIDKKGNVVARAQAFEEALHSIDYQDKKIISEISTQHSEEASIYHALMLGTKDYIEKNGFKGVLLGLSGGIDSALTYAVAVDALGAERVHPVLMPSQYTSDMSNHDALEQVKAMGSKHSIVAIKQPFDAFLETLADEFKGLKADTTEENIQARIRGVLLMAMSNKTGKLVLTTGNKSEMAVGYATLYGDMAGAFAVIKDVPKTMVYRLAEYRNRLSPVIPERVITRPPSAELAPNQTDQDSLPDYPTLDKILHHYVEENLGIREIIKLGFEEEHVRKVVRLIDINEYKRRQAAPGVKISKRAFGRDWRYPITSGFHQH